MKRFEYDSVVIPNGESLVTQLNPLGEAGWEAIDFYRPQGYTIITLKREKLVEAKTVFTQHAGRIQRIQHNHATSLACDIQCPLRGTENEIVKED